jgi:pilus assembly protein FimV
MVAKRSSRALALLLVLPSAAFALGLGDIRLLSPLNAPLDAEIELVDVTPEELNGLQAQVASRDTFARYGLEWPVFMSGVQVRTTRTADGHQIIKVKSTDSITEPFITLLIEVNWSRGKLVREYTMLLDPPVYTPGQSAVANAPVASPSAGTGAREGEIPRGTDRATPAAAADVSAASTQASPTKGAPAPSEATAASAGAASGAGNTHLVKRGESLSQIASVVAGARPNSAQAHSWMLAIYQANPQAFDKNMNRLRSGAVLRVPDGSAAAAVSPAAALTEIRRQYAAWRGTASAGASSSPEPGQLHLVTPSESASAGTGGASEGEAKALKGRVHDLEGQLSESKRLLEMRNAELADLQSRLAGQKAPAATPQPSAPAVQTAAPAPQTAAPTPPAEQPPAAQAEPPPATPAPAHEPPAQAAEPAPPPVAATKAPAPVTKPAPQAEGEGGGFLDTLKDLWWVVALLIVALLGFAGFRFWRSRRQSEFDDSLGRLAVAGAHSAERGFAAGEMPLRPTSAATPEGAFLVEESGTHERSRFSGGGAPAAAAARHVATDETISSETAINLDQGDPLAEADFHMAYGLYDQAADLIRIAISREPARRDLKLKLLEVFFVWGNKEQFLHAARELADMRAEAVPGEWEKIVIMGKQLAPEDPLFSGGAVGGAMAGGVDLDLEGGQNRVDFDLVGEPVPGMTGGDVDLDIGSALGDADATAESPTNATDRSAALLEHSFTDASTATTRQMTARLQEPDPMMPEFGPDAEGPTVEQPALSSPENPTIRQKVEIALRHSGADQTAELAIDDLGLDLGALDTIDQPGLGASSDAPTLVAGLDERSRKVMEDAQQRTASEDRISSTGAWHLDEAELESALAQRGARGAENGHDHGHESEVTSRLSALSGREEVDFDLGDGEVAHATNGAGVDLDVGTATVPDAAFTATQKISSDDLALPDLEPVTMSEVGTKLDLARAYMDMGDPDGARNILEEVLHEGSVAQKQEAQRLMESLPG